ncbi:MAG: hypothetical protein Q9185_000508 [Variospora sp. 1 TL-2023]
MPYNTRRKSLSLPSLGIQLPNASRPHRPSISKAATASESSPPQPPTKKVKRAHTSGDALPSTPPRPRPRSSTASSSTKSVSFAAERPKSSGRTAYEHTPPPSPGASHYRKIDTDGINDDIVTGVIEQLEKTGNRPHLIKELSTVLSTINDSVLSSANPVALLSSRLAAYLRRDCWTALSPCPLAKELIPVHPRKVFYYLTTQPRQEIHADSSDIFASPLTTSLSSNGIGGKRIISPSLSNASVDDDDADAAELRNREVFSPSPEVDLSIPELDTVTQPDDDFRTPPTPAGSTLSGRSSLARDGSIGSASENMDLARNHRAQSPPLEGDEKEFTQTASSMRMRGMSFDDQSVRPSTEAESHLSATVGEMQLDESEDDAAHRDQEDGVALFGGHPHPQEMGPTMMSSPIVKPVSARLSAERAVKDISADVEMKEPSSILGNQGYDWAMREPENIRLEELDELLGGF